MRQMLSQIIWDERDVRDVTCVPAGPFNSLENAGGQWGQRAAGAARFQFWHSVEAMSLNEVILAEPGADLVHQIKGMIPGLTDGGVVALALSHFCSCQCALQLCRCNRLVSRILCGS